MGASWLIGALDALEAETGWRAVDAERIVGTSAGAVVGALAAGGIPSEYMSAYASGRTLDGFVEAESRADALSRRLPGAKRLPGSEYRLELALPPIGPGILAAGADHDPAPARPPRAAGTPHARANRIGPAGRPAAGPRQSNRWAPTSAARPPTATADTARRPPARRTPPGPPPARPAAWATKKKEKEKKQKEKNKKEKKKKKKKRKRGAGREGISTRLGLDRSRRACAGTRAPACTPRGCRPQPQRSHDGPRRGADDALRVDGAPAGLGLERIPSR